MSLPGGIWVPPRSHVGASGVTHECHRGHVGATMCGWHQGHIGWHQGHMWVSEGSCGCHQVWVPPRSRLGDTGVSSGCHRARVGATVSGCHPGHMWVPVVSCGCHCVWVPPRSHWVPPRSHVGDAGVTHGCHCSHVGATMSGWHQGHIGCHPGHMCVPVVSCGCHCVWVPPRSHWVPPR